MNDLSDISDEEIIEFYKNHEWLDNYRISEEKRIFWREKYLATEEGKREFKSD